MKITLLVAGSAMIGFLIPEWLLLFPKADRKIPLMHNIFTSIAFGIIALGIMLV